MRGVRMGALAFGAAVMGGCATSVSVVPEHDLAMSHQSVREAMRIDIERFCRDRGFAVETLQTRLKRFGGGVAVAMQASCDGGDVQIECSFDTPESGDGAYNCASIPP